MKKIYILLFMTLCTLGLSAQTTWSVSPYYMSTNDADYYYKYFTVKATSKHYRTYTYSFTIGFPTEDQILNGIKGTTNVKDRVATSESYTNPGQGFLKNSTIKYRTYAFVYSDEDGNPDYSTLIYYNYYFDKELANSINYFEVQENGASTVKNKKYDVILGPNIKYYKYKVVYNASSIPKISKISTELNSDAKTVYGDGDGTLSIDLDRGDGYYSVIMQAIYCKEDDKKNYYISESEKRFDYFVGLNVSLGNHNVSDTGATLDLNVTKDADVAYWKYGVGSSTTNAKAALTSNDPINENSATVSLSTKGYNYIVVQGYNADNEIVNTTYYDKSRSFFSYYSALWKSLGKKKFTNNLTTCALFGNMASKTYLVDVDRLPITGGAYFYRIKNPFARYSSMDVKNDRYLYLKLDADGSTVSVFTSFIGVGGEQGEYRFAQFSSDVNGTYEDNKITFEDKALCIFVGMTGNTASRINGEFCLDLNDLTKTVDLSHNWGTIGLDYPVEIPAGVVAYKASLDGSVVNLTQFGEEGDVIPANTGAILYAENPKSYDFVATDDADAVTGNALKAAIETYNYTADENVYYLGLDGEKVVFKHLTSGSIAAGKAYLLAPKASEAKLDVVVEGTPTGITEVVPMAVKNDGIYNIQGVRVNNSFKGVVIMNGKKYLKK